MTTPAGTEGALRQVRGSFANAAAGLFAREPMLAAAAVLFLIFAVTSPVFGSLANIENILRQMAPVLLLGLGMMIVVLIGGIDLSVGSVVLASSVAAGVALLSGFTGPIAIVCALAVGAGAGALNAVLIEVLRISPVIVTLGSMIAIRGLALVVLGEYSSWITIKAPLFDWLARARLGGVPVDALVVILLTAAVALIMTRTVFGRRFYAVGDNAVSARLCGLPVKPYRMAAYVACGAFAGLGGILFAARTSIVSPSIGLGLEFYAIAVVALGAGGLPPGRVKAFETLVGALILTMVFNYMTIRGIGGTWQTTATGLLLLLAMLVGRLAQGRGGDEAAVGWQSAGEHASGRLASALGQNAIIIASLVLAAVFAVINPRFATIANLITLVEQNTALAIVAVGAMMGIVSRCVDISPGSVVALGAVIAALAFQAGMGPMPSLLLGLLACLATYVLNGAIVGWLGLDPLIVTLAAWIWARGLAISLTGAHTIPFDQGFVRFMNTAAFVGFTPGAVLMVVAFAAGWLVLSRLPIGIRLYALGNDARMLRQAGVDDRLTRMKVLAIMGAFTAAGMIVMLGRLGAAAPTAGFGLELDAIVAVIVGGASFRGGEGTLRGTAIGVIFLAVLNNGLSGLQIGDAGFFLIKGSAILAALTLRAAVRFLPTGEGR